MIYTIKSFKDAAKDADGVIRFLPALPNTLMRVYRSHFAREFDYHTVQTFLCIRMFVCIGSGGFLCTILSKKGYK
jgi:hypothetical protein